MLIKRDSSLLKNEKGMAIFEAIPIIIVIVLFLNFSFGFFGVIHTGILNSIASRNYAFETFRHRANLVYFRNTLDTEPSGVAEFSRSKSRLHGTISENSLGILKWHATTRTIDFFDFSRRAVEKKGVSRSEHSRIRTLAGGRVSESVHGGVNPVWIKTAYGICMDSACEQ